MLRRRLCGVGVVVAIASCAPQPVTVNNNVTTQVAAVNTSAARPTVVAAAANAAPGVVKRAAPSGTRQRIDSFAALNADCSSMGVPVVRVQAAPTHGTMVSEAADYFTTYPKDNQRYACNVKKSTGALVYYTSAAGYTGPDSALINVVFPDGGTRTIRYSITVE